MQAAGGAALSADETLTADETASGAAPVGTDPPKAKTSRGRAVAVLVGAAVTVLSLDALTKQIAVSQLSDHEPVRLLGGAVYLVLTRNSGAAFSLGTGHTIVFPLFTLIVVSWIAWMARRLRSLPWALALGLVLGGALGNVADRLFRAPGPLVGHVVDFVSLFDDSGQFWPVFNLADSALSIGVVLAVLLELTGRRRDGVRTSRKAAPDEAEPTRS